MLQAMREFGLERLEASGEEQEVRAAHAAHYLSLVEQASAQIDDPDYERVLERLDVEYDNVILALTWARQPGRPSLDSAWAKRWVVTGRRVADTAKGDSCWNGVWVWENPLRRDSPERPSRRWLAGSPSR